jgi:hypothetical protein
MACKFAQSHTRATKPLGELVERTAASTLLCSFSLQLHCKHSCGAHMRSSQRPPRWLLLRLFLARFSSMRHAGARQCGSVACLAPPTDLYAAPQWTQVKIVGSVLGAVCRYSLAAAARQMRRRHHTRGDGISWLHPLQGFVFFATGLARVGVVRSASDSLVRAFFLL